MSARARAVAAARGAVGTKFRLHGRDPAYGVDCVGLAALALRAAGYKGDVPADYALRGGVADHFVALVDRGAMVRVDPPMPGDIVLFAVSAAQFHVAIMTPGGFAHADAVLGRVVERPGAPPWPIVAAWALIDEAAAWERLAE